MMILKWVKLVKFLRMLLFRYVITHISILPFIHLLIACFFFCNDFQVEKIDIAFSKIPKRVNMKHMITYTKMSIDRQFGKREFAKFSSIYKDLLKTSLARNLSPSLSLFAVLHNANEHRYRLNSEVNPETDTVVDIKINKTESHTEINQTESHIEIIE